MTEISRGIVMEDIRGGGKGRDFADSLHKDLQLASLKHRRYAGNENASSIHVHICPC